MISHFKLMQLIYGDFASNITADQILMRVDSFSCLIIIFCRRDSEWDVKMRNDSSKWRWKFFDHLNPSRIRLCCCLARCALRSETKKRQILRNVIFLLKLGGLFRKPNDPHEAHGFSHNRSEISIVFFIEPNYGVRIQWILKLFANGFFPFFVIDHFIDFFALAICF